MTHEIHRSQNISFPVIQETTPPVATAKRLQVPNPQDTLRLGAKEQGPSCLAKAWGSVVNFFQNAWSSAVGFVKSIFPFFFSSAPSSKEKIEEMATKHHFLWFYHEQANPLTAFLGNFHPCKVKLGDLEFKCAEAAYQAAKFQGNAEVMRQFQSLDGEAAFQKARELSANWTPQDKAAWQARNGAVMRDALVAKFSQNPELKELLLATKDAYLVEHSKRDRFWADNLDGTGQNNLGQGLMLMRRHLGGTGLVPKNAQYQNFIASPRT